MTQEIFNIIRNNIPLRESIAEYLKVTVQTVYGHAFRKSKKLNNAIVVEIIKKHTGKELKDIFSQEELNFIK